MHRVCTVVFPVYRCNAFVWLFFLYCRGFKWIVMDDFCRHWSEEVSLSINKLHVTRGNARSARLRGIPLTRKYPGARTSAFTSQSDILSVPTAFHELQNDSSGRSLKSEGFFWTVSEWFFRPFFKYQIYHLNVLQMSKWFLRVFSKYTMIHLSVFNVRMILRNVV